MQGDVCLFDYRPVARRKIWAKVTNLRVWSGNAVLSG